MLNRFLNKIADSGKTEKPRNANGNDLPSPTNYGNSVAAEGFLCPGCMLGFPSPELLQDHYETSHSGNGADKGATELHVCSACKMKLGSAVELESHYTRHHTILKSPDQPDLSNNSSLRQELDELHTSLKEERWYSDELKKEVSRLQSSVEFVQSDGSQKNDAEQFYQSQIKMLEESKSLVLSEVDLLKEHLNDCRGELSRVRNDKDKLEQKAAFMAGEIADLKSKLDELLGEKCDFFQRLKDAQNTIDDLHSEVEQRLGQEDALLLRQELVTVQSLMDQLTMEKEVEKDNLQKICDKQEMDKLKLMSALEEAPDQAELERLRATVIDLNESLKSKTTELEKLNFEKDQQLSSAVKSADQELFIAREQIVESEKETNQLKESLKKFENAFQKLRAENEIEVSEIRAKMQQEAKENLAQLLTVRSEGEKFNQQLQDRETEIKKLKTCTSQLDVKLREKETAIRELGEQFNAKTLLLENTEEQVFESKEKSSKFENECSKLKDQIEKLETERTELYEKIELGDGAKTAMQQLQQANVGLQEKLLKQEELNKEIQEKARQRLEELNLTLKQETEKRKTTEKEIIELRNKLSGDQLHINELAIKITEIKNKSTVRENELSELKGQNMSEKLEFEHQLVSKQAELQEFQRQFETMQTLLKETKLKLSDEQSKSSELSKSLKISKEELSKTVIVAQSNEAKIHLMQSEMDANSKLLVNAKGHSVKLENELQQLEIAHKQAKKECAVVQQKSESNSVTIRTLTSEHDTLKTELGSLKENSSHLIQQLEESNKKLMNANEEIIKLKTENEEGLKSLHKLEGNCAELKERTEEAEKTIQNEALKFAQLQQDLDKAREDLKLCNEKMATAFRELENTVVKNASLEILLAELEKTGNSLSADKSKLESNIAKTEEELSLAKTKVDSLKSTCSDLKAIISQTQESLEQEQKLVSDAEAGKAILIEQKLKVQSELEAAISKWKNIEIEQTSYIEDYRLKEESLKDKINTLIEQLEEEKRTLTHAQQSWEDSRSQFEGQASVLTENLNTLQQDLFVEKNRAATLESKVDELGGYKLDLEAKLENALDERRALLDRCLRSEDEGEKLRIATTDLRRKVDDTLAALHELGRENQSLQIENTKLVQRKWAEDAEVTHCTACRKQFTVTLRKHHCRSCGSIFCNECSARTATIASYKKAVRVCDCCFDEVGQ